MPDGLAADQLSEWNEFLAWKRCQAAPASVAGDDDGDNDNDSETHDVPPDRSDPAGLVADAARARRPVARVHLHRGHFAFMRCYIEGLNIGARWDHYLGQHGEATDLRAVHRAVRQLRGDLVAIARRHDRHGLARLLGLNVRDMGGTAQSASRPTLDAFVAERGLEDWSMNEQLRYYEEDHGAPTRRERAGARLLARQLAALRWLEQQAATTPLAADPPGAWLIPELAAPIEAAGITTLGQLAERINGMAAGWHASLHGIGEGKATRIVAWLRATASDTLLAIGAHVDTPRRQLTAAALDAVTAPAAAVLPFGKFAVPAALCGAAGQYRAPAAHCVIGAQHDLDALQAYIRTRPALPLAERQARLEKWRRQHPGEEAPTGLRAWLLILSPTAAAYLQEIHRCMLWAVLERQKALSSLDQLDAAAYQLFLSDPQPAVRWCSGARGREKFGPSWRPFAGPLGSASAGRAITVLSAFFTYLRDGGYVVANPFKGIGKALEPLGPQVERSLTVVEWGAVLRALDALPVTLAGARLRFGIRLMYATGLRRAETVAAKVGDLRWVSYPPDDDDQETVEGWELVVMGKGRRERRVPVPPAVIDDLSAYLRLRGLGDDVRHADNAAVPLLGHVVDGADPLAGIGAQTWYDALKGFFGQVASKMEHTAPSAAAQLRRASSHWLRHTRVSHSLAAGTDADVERLVAGHRSLATTSGYAHAEGKRRLRGSERFFDSWGVRSSTP
jgi:site-specific recombinase XerD